MNKNSQELRINVWICIKITTFCIKVSRVLFCESHKKSVQHSTHFFKKEMGIELTF